MSLRQSTALQNKPVRDSNIELLRIFTMFGVVILHYNSASIGGGFRFAAAGTTNEILLKSLEGLFICAVDLFILISGYFSCTSKRADPAKAFALLLQVIAFNGIKYGYSVLNGGSFSSQEFLQALLPANYFVWLYIATYLLSPYINTMLSALTKKQRNHLMMLALILFSIWPALMDVLQKALKIDMTSLSTISLYGNQDGYTITNFLLMYLLGAWLRLSDLTIKKRYSFPVLVLCAAGITLFSKKAPGIAWSYHNPLVILEAAASFCLFRQFSFRSKFVNFLAKGAFSCYLLHILFLPKFHIQQATQGSAPGLLLHVVFCAITIYLMCFVVHLVYALLSKPLVSLIGKLFQKLHFTISVN